MGVLMEGVPAEKRQAILSLYISPYICQSVLVPVFGTGDYRVNQQIIGEKKRAKSIGRTTVGTNHAANYDRCVTEFVFVPVGRFSMSFT
jgi:hypothetical protein